MKRTTGFEPVSSAWGAEVLPLDDIRVSTSGGIRTLAGRLRGGCSTDELRRRFARPCDSGRCFTTAIQLSESKTLRAVLLGVGMLGIAPSGPSGGSGFTGRCVCFNALHPRERCCETREAGSPFGSPASVETPREDEASSVRNRVVDCGRTRFRRTDTDTSGHPAGGATGGR